MTMPSMTRALFVTAALLFAASTAPLRTLRAQVAHAAGLDLTVGAHGVSGVMYKERTVPLLEALLAIRVHRGAQWSLVAAGSAGTTATLASNDSCTFLPDGGCAPTQQLWMGSALIGIARQLDASTTARLFIGPAVYSHSGNTDWGTQVRADLALILGNRVGIGPMARLTLLPDHRGETATMWALGVSLSFRDQ